MLSVDEINKLQEENERLKAEVETWKYQTQKSDEMSDEDYRNAKRYKTCLQEIQVIANRAFVPGAIISIDDIRNDYHQILQLIDKAEV